MAKLATATFASTLLVVLALLAPAAHARQVYAYDDDFYAYDDVDADYSFWKKLGGSLGKIGKSAGNIAISQLGQRAGIPSSLMGRIPRFALEDELYAYDDDADFSFWKKLGGSLGKVGKSAGNLAISQLGQRYGLPPSLMGRIPRFALEDELYAYDDDAYAYDDDADFSFWKKLGGSLGKVGKSAGNLAISQLGQRYGLPPSLMGRIPRFALEDELYAYDDDADFSFWKKLGGSLGKIGKSAGNIAISQLGRRAGIPPSLMGRIPRFALEDALYADNVAEYSSKQPVVLVLAPPGAPAPPKFKGRF